jgi:DNA segregation ATPase FtsK/SpoIIIE-like protein
MVKIFAEYNAPVRMAGPPVIGPAFIRYFVTPNKGIPIKKVTALARDVQARLELSAEPFIGLSLGKTTIDIQRPDRQVLTFAGIRGQLGTRDAVAGSSRVPVGVDLEGRLRCADLATPEHTHVLVAGTAGSGKSEWLRCAIAGLIATNTPATLRLVLIDPKRNAFNALKGSPFLFNAKAFVYPDETDVNDVLDQLIDEMEARYRVLEQHGADNLKQLVQKTGRPVPRIVCVCDEYADLISRGKKERRAVEERLQRLGNKARASGIHLILATQNPSREVVKGTLDTNMPCRVGLKTSKLLESKMLLNQGGAENLLGHGDLFFRDIGEARRYQAPLLSEEDRRELFGKA